MGIGILKPALKSAPLGVFAAMGLCVAACQVDEGGSASTENGAQNFNVIECDSLFPKKNIFLPMKWRRLRIRLEGSTLVSQKRSGDQTNLIQTLFDCSSDAQYLLVSNKRPYRKVHKDLLNTSFSYLKLWDHLTVEQVLNWAPQCKTQKYCDLTQILTDETNPGSFKTHHLAKWRKWVQPKHSVFKVAHPGNIGMTKIDMDGNQVFFLYSQLNGKIAFVGRAPNGLNILIEISMTGEKVASSHIMSDGDFQKFNQAIGRLTRSFK